MKGSPSRKGTVTTLLEALQALHLDAEAEIAFAGRWAKLNGERCPIYIIETATGGFFTWCDVADERSVEFYRDPQMAIVAGLRRAARREEEVRAT